MRSTMVVVGLDVTMETLLLPCILVDRFAVPLWTAYAAVHRVSRASIQLALYVPLPYS